MYSYVCFYQRQSVEVQARTSFEAQCKAQEAFEKVMRLRPGSLARKSYLISVHAAARPDGTVITHSTASL
jgi:hypothetical protein